ncbi:MAG: MmgE/PrpD family protein [Pseudomonadota bacterium]
MADDYNGPANWLAADLQDPAPLALALAEALAQIDIDRVSSRAIDAATLGIADTVGVTLLGATEDVSGVLQRALAGEIVPGPALLFGGRRRIGMLDAAMFNGTAAHAADYDDMARNMGGHPSVTLVPVLFALGEARGASGRQLLEAYIVGFEAACRLGRVVHPHHYEKGWHPTSTLGVFGAAAAAARLLRLDPARTATALALAASMSSGVKANFGTMTKPFHVGQCCRDGLMAAQLAAGGFTANPRALEHKQGFFASYDGLENVHPERMLAQWGELLEIEQESVGLKQFPCCGSTHPAIRAMLGMASQGLRHEDVESIAITVNRQRLPHTDNPQPQSGLAAKFSVQYVTARALTDGAVRLEHFEGDSHLDPRVRRLMALTSVGAYPETGDDTLNMENKEFAAHLTVTTRDGRTLSSIAPHALGRGGANAMNKAEMREKYSDCARRVLPAAQAASSFDALWALRDDAPLQALTALLETAPPAQP